MAEDTSRFRFRVVVTPIKAPPVRYVIEHIDHGVFKLPSKPQTVPDDPDDDDITPPLSR